jgi:hypothetical protein
MDENTFLGIYNEFTHFTESEDNKYSELISAYHDWAHAQKETNSAYNHYKCFTDGDEFADSEKVDGREAAQEYMNSALVNYKAWKERRNDYKDKFLKLLKDFPEFSSTKATELGEEDLAKYLLRLEASGERQSSYMEFENGLPKVGTKVKVDIASYKVSDLYDIKTRDGRNTVGYYVTAYDKNGVCYNFPVDSQSGRHAKDKIEYRLESFEGIVKNIVDYYGKKQVKLGFCKLNFANLAVSEEELLKELDRLKKTAEVIEIKDKKELPENARLYMESCYRTNGEYSWWIHYKGIYKVGENSYRYIVTDDYCTLD